MTSWAAWPLLADMGLDCWCLQELQAPTAVILEAAGRAGYSAVLAEGERAMLRDGARACLEHAKRR